LAKRKEQDPPDDPRFVVPWGGEEGEERRDYKSDGDVPKKSHKKNLLKLSGGKYEQ